MTGFVLRQYLGISVVSSFLIFLTLHKKGTHVKATVLPVCVSLEKLTSLELILQESDISHNRFSVGFNPKTVKVYTFINRDKCSVSPPAVNNLHTMTNRRISVINTLKHLLGRGVIWMIFSISIINYCAYDANCLHGERSLCLAAAAQLEEERVRQ